MDNIVAMLVSQEHIPQRTVEMIVVVPVEVRVMLQEVSERSAEILGVLMPLMRWPQCFCAENVCLSSRVLGTALLDRITVSKRYFRLRVTADIVKH